MVGWWDSWVVGWWDISAGTTEGIHPWLAYETCPANAYGAECIWSLSSGPRFGGQGAVWHLVVLFPPRSRSVSKESVSRF